MSRETHLGDGAYVSFLNGQVVLTANHHDPDEATDAVWLDGQAVLKLEGWIQNLLRSDPQAE